MQSANNDDQQSFIHYVRYEGKAAHKLLGLAPLGNSSYSAFERFLRCKRSSLRNIVGKTRDELELEDIQNEAWVTAMELQRTHGHDVDFENPSYQDLLMRFLYQKLVRYTEKNIRHAVRLDHWAYGDDPTHDTHPILNQLSANASTDPVTLLHAKYDEIATAQIPGPHHSRASAYAHLLDHFDNRVQEVARHLLISVSYCYARISQAALMAQYQLVLHQGPQESNDEFFPGPWRTFKLERKCRQGEFDFWPDESLLNSFVKRPPCDP